MKLVKRVINGVCRRVRLLLRRLVDALLHQRRRMLAEPHHVREIRELLVNLIELISEDRVLSQAAHHLLVLAEVMMRMRTRRGRSNIAYAYD